MAYLRISKRGKRRYCYIVQSVRGADTVKQKVLEYLGRDPDPVRLKRAMAYWRVGTKRKGRKKP